AAVLSSDMDHTDNVVGFIHECRQIDIDILAPQVNHSEYKFTVADPQTIRYGLGAIKGVGFAAIEGLLVERQANGPFKDLEDLCRRMDLQKVNKRVLEAMIRAGALDGLGPNRATLMARLPEALASAQQQTRASEAGQNDMFGVAAARVAVTDRAAAPVSLPDWDESERLRNENETLGLYLTGHPINRYKRELQQALGDTTLGDLGSESPPPPSRDGERIYTRPRSVTIYGLLIGVRKKGNRVILTLDDNTGRMEVVFFEDGFAKFKHVAQKDRILVVEGGFSYDEFNRAWRINKVKDMYDLDTLRQRRLARLDITLDKERLGPEFIAALKAALKADRDGRVAIRIQVRSIEQGLKVLTPIPNLEGWRIQPSEALIRSLDALLRPDELTLSYAPRSAAAAPPEFAYA